MQWAKQERLRGRKRLMPKICRTMWKAEDDSPTVGTDSHMLGARITGKQTDISPDSDGNVHPDTGGISVARSINDLLPHLIPKRLRDHFEDAAGSNSRFVWSMGAGEFSEGIVADDLLLRLKPKNAPGKVQGLVEPTSMMMLQEYQSALAATRPRWTIDEPK